MAQCEPCVQIKKKKRIKRKKIRKVKRKKRRVGDGEVGVRGKKNYRERSSSFSIKFTVIES